MDPGRGVQIGSGAKVRNNIHTIEHSCYLLLRFAAAFVSDSRKTRHGRAADDFFLEVYPLTREFTCSGRFDSLDSHTGIFYFAWQSRVKNRPHIQTGRKESLD